jgi:hypothetical protein
MVGALLGGTTVTIKSERLGWTGAAVFGGVAVTL